MTKFVHLLWHEYSCDQDAIMPTRSYRYTVLKNCPNTTMQPLAHEFQGQLSPKHTFAKGSHLEKGMDYGEMWPKTALCISIQYM